MFVSGSVGLGGEAKTFDSTGESRQVATIRCKLIYLLYVSNRYLSIQGLQPLVDRFLVCFYNVLAAG